MITKDQVSYIQALVKESEEIITKIKRHKAVTRGEAAVLANWDNIWELMDDNKILLLSIKEEEK